ncbi:hypothetical protein KBY22_07935 [Ruegeria pomeroyi]|uniref:Secreted protein n=1 Tax=Ruegeria alba TaxID=2916756 RepID=A0ABS9NV21_9RHOB|nr:hypothetical protein [Ruegeria alba]MCE8512617.1 hypothetical protein [Ruegeria pomeroyi]MCE8521745.1 hypothetical protein [Ruegeria pomeroyi]MCE8529430.1 hypothetical protein [Ruegeria pomeroyi]MCG6558074.1 hypothetical protein [Ruegeria alba]
MRSLLMTALVIAPIAPLEAQHSRIPQPTRDQCICIAVCQATNRPAWVSGPPPTCPHIRDELIIDNRATCACPAWPPAQSQSRPAPGRESPNH